MKNKLTPLPSEALRRQLPGTLAAVEGGGACYRITSHGRPVALLVPLEWAESRFDAPIAQESGHAEMCDHVFGAEYAGWDPDCTCGPCRRVLSQAIAVRRSQEAAP
jgi:prevent-host-death family protein